MSKNAYSQLVEDITAKVQAQNQARGHQSCAVSKSDMENMATALINSPDHTVTMYPFSSKDTSGTGGPTGIDKCPGRRYRDSLKPVLRQLGLDKDDVAKIDDIPLGKENAAAIMDVATTVIKDYLVAGRKFSFPITGTDETRMEISCVRAPERTSVGNRFAKDDSANNTVTITSERTALKAKNAVPFWLKQVKS